MRRVVGYVRVSTDKQADAGHSLEAQRAKLAAWCSLYDAELVEVFVDAGASGGSTSGRPGYAAALEALDAKRADTLLVVKLDRLTRSTRDLADVLDAARRGGWALTSVAEQLDTSTAAGRLVVGVLGVVAQWEREAVGERTSAAMQSMKERGLYTGGRVRYGYRVGHDGQLVEDEGEQATLAAIRELRAAGLSLRAVAAELEARGMVNRNGARFGPSTLARLEAAA